MDVDTILSEYISTGLWLSQCNGTAAESHSDPAKCRGEDCDKGLDDLGFTIEDLTEEALASALADVEDLISSSLEERDDIFEGMTDEAIGYNFWLTRNGHGAGFWDLGLGERGDWLTAQSKPFGESTLYVNANGEVEVQ